MPAQTPDELHSLFLEAFNGDNLDAVMALYEDTALLVPQPGTITTGQQANRQALLQFLALKGTMRMRTVFSLKNGNIALLRGEWTLHAIGSDGKPIEMSGRSVEVARRQSDGTWRFAIDHPFGASEGHEFYPVCFAEPDDHFIPPPEFNR